MIKLIISIIFIQQFIMASDCDDFHSYMNNAQSYASDSYSYAKKAYRNMDDIDYAERYIKKAYRAASDAESEASSAEYAAMDCDCDDGQYLASNVQSYLSDSYSYAKKAYRNMDDIDYAERYIKKAYRAASDAESEASSYNYYCD